MATEIKNCNCKSDYQDLRYGKGNRVYNVSAKAGTKTSRCTVCLNTMKTSSSTIAKSKK